MENIVNYTFNKSITCENYKGILLKEYVNPSESDFFVITIGCNAVIKGKDATLDDNSPYVFKLSSSDIVMKDGIPYGVANPDIIRGPNGIIGGACFNLDGFKNKYVTFIIEGTIMPGTGSVGGLGVGEYTFKDKKYQFKGDIGYTGNYGILFSNTDDLKFFDYR